MKIVSLILSILFYVILVGISPKGDVNESDLTHLVIPYSKCLSRDNYNGFYLTYLISNIKKIELREDGYHVHIFGKFTDIDEIKSHRTTAISKKDLFFKNLRHNLYLKEKKDKIYLNMNYKKYCNSFEPQLNLIKNYKGPHVDDSFVYLKNSIVFVLIYFFSFILVLVVEQIRKN